MRPNLTPKAALALAEALYATSGERDHRLEAVVIKEPLTAHFYARGVINGPWPEAEKIIAKDAKVAFAYAFVVLGLPDEEARLWRYVGVLPRSVQSFSRRTGILWNLDKLAYDLRLRA